MLHLLLNDLISRDIYQYQGQGGDDGGNMGDIQQVLAKVDSWSSSAEAVKEPVGSVPMEMDNTFTHVHKKAWIA